MITVKRLSECTFEEATELWNLGFSGYAVDFTMSVDDFAAWVGSRGGAPSLSLAAFVDGKPAGVVLNMFNRIDGPLIAWNGGTGIAPPFRGQGIGKVLMQKAIEIYREACVDYATLEVLTNNESGVKLYERTGYVKSGRLLTLKCEGALENGAFSYKREAGYQAVIGGVSDVRDLEFFNNHVPYCSMWQNIQNGQSLRVLDADNEMVGYAVYRQRIGYGNALKDHISLFHCVAKPGRTDREDIIRFALSHVFSPYAFEGLRTVGDYPSSNEQVVQALMQAGFKITAERFLMNTPPLAGRKETDVHGKTVS